MNIIYAKKKQDFKWPQKEVYLVSFIVLVAVILRLLAITGKSLWYDELQSVTMADRTILFSILSPWTHDCHPPLYSFFLSLWLNIGTSDFTILMSSVLLSGLSVLLTYLVAKQIWNPKVGFWSAGILAIHSFSLFWSVYARMYSLIMVLCLCCILANWVYFQITTHPKKRLVFIVVISQAGLVYSHLAGLFFLFFILLFSFLLHRTNRSVLKRWIRLQLFSCLAYIPAMEFPLQKSNIGHAFAPNWSQFASGLSYFGGWTGQLGILAVAGICLWVSIVFLLPYKSESKSRWLSICLMVAPIVIAFTVSHAGKPMWIAPRTFAFMVPFTAIGAALLLVTGNSVAWLRIAKKFVAFGYISVLLAGTLNFLTTYEKPTNYREAAQIILKQMQPNDAVLTLGIRDAWAIRWYLSGNDWDQDIEQEVIAAWKEDCQIIKGPNCLFDKIKEYDRKTTSKPLPVLSSETRSNSLPDDTSRVWVITRSEKHWEKIRSIYRFPKDLKIYHSSKGLNLRLFQKSNLSTRTPLHLSGVNGVHTSLRSHSYWSPSLRNVTPPPALFSKFVHQILRQPWIYSNTSHV